MENEFKYEMGLKAVDIITGFEGVIIGRSQWLTGCNTYGLRPKMSKDGKLPESQFFDEAQITVTGKPLKLGETVKKKDPVQDNGGPQETPQKTNRF